MLRIAFYKEGWQYFKIESQYDETIQTSQLSTFNFRFGTESVKRILYWDETQVNKMEKRAKWSRLKKVCKLGKHSDDKFYPIYTAILQIQNWHE